MRIGKSDGMLFLSWSDTIDAAIIRNGELHHLPDLAHIKAQRDGECTCGGRGCLEAAASGNALLAKTGAESIKDLVRNNSYGYAVKEAMHETACSSPCRSRSGAFRLKRDDNRRIVTAFR